MDWDEINTISGLTIGYETASAIIDICDCHQLKLFNAPRLANPHMSTGEQVEIFLKAMAEARNEGREQHEQLGEIRAGEAEGSQLAKRGKARETEGTTGTDEKQTRSVRISRAMKDFVRKRSLRRGIGVAEQDVCLTE